MESIGENKLLESNSVCKEALLTANDFKGGEFKHFGAISSF